MIRKYLAACAGVVAASLIATAAPAAVSFSFTFNAPFNNGDTASGSGTVVTDDADPDGYYAVQSITGTWTQYSTGPTQTFNTVAVSMFDFGQPSLFQNGSGAFVTSGISFSYLDLEAGDFGPGIQFSGGANPTPGGYDSFSGEVGGQNATLAFTQADAVADVPEPASWAMMVAGFGLVGGAIRRRKTSVAFA